MTKSIAIFAPAAQTALEIFRAAGYTVQKAPKVTGKGQTYFVNKIREVMGNV